jgi:hypothetical protein
MIVAINQYAILYADKQKEMKNIIAVLAFAMNAIAVFVVVHAQIVKKNVVNVVNAVNVVLVANVVQWVALK